MFWMAYAIREALLAKKAAESFAQEELIFPPLPQDKSKTEYFLSQDPTRQAYYRHRDPGCIEFYLSKH